MRGGCRRTPRSSSPSPGAHCSGQKPEQNYAQHGNALAVHTTWLRAGTSEPSSHRRADGAGNQYEEGAQPLYFSASWWAETGKTCCLGRRPSSCLSLGLSFSFESLSGETSPSSLPRDEREAAASEDRHRDVRPARPLSDSCFTQPEQFFGSYSLSYSSLEPRKQPGMAVPIVSVSAAEDTPTGSALTQLW